MKWKPYPNYKESGVEWLGAVPEGWRTIAVKWLSPVLRGASPRPIEDPKYFDDEGEYAWVRISDVTAAGPYLRETTQRLSNLGSSLSVKLQPGQLFLSIAATVGQPCIAATKACIHDGFVYFPRLKENPRFLYYLFAAGEAYRGLGKLGTQLNLNTDTVGSIRIGLPPPEEVDAVVAFLDRETAKIDTLIAKQERLIDLLQEKRQALISHAVTKGLNPDAPMKPSGVEWLGDVPAHWVVIALKRVCDLITDGTHQPPQRTDDGYPLLSVRNLVGGRFTNLPDDSHISEVEYRSLVKHFRVESGDVVLAIVGATLGKVALVEAMPPFAIQRSLAVIRTKPVKLLNKYLLYYIRSSFLQELLWRSVGFSAQPGIYLGDLANIPLPLPPQAEQVQIVERLEFRLLVLGDLEYKAQQSIELMRERRTALISAAVTGKIDVREPAYA